MRTTVELTDEQRSKLLQLAAERGEKGFSKLVQEAVDEYLKAHLARRELIESARSVLGTADDDLGQRLEESVRRTRESWRGSSSTRTC